MLAAGVLCVLAIHGSADAPIIPGSGGPVMAHSWAYGRLLDGITLVVGHGAWAGKAIAVLAGIGAVVGATRMLGPWAGLWLIAQSVMLQAGTTVGSTLPALALGLGGLDAALRGQSGWSGVFVGLAVLMDPSAWPLAIVCWFALRPGIGFLGMLCLATIPVWAQGMGPDVVLPSGTAALQLWSGTLLARAQIMVGKVPLILGVVAIIWGVMRKNRASRLLLLWVGVLIGMTLVLPSADVTVPLTAAIVLGVAAVETGPALLLGSLIVLGLNLAAW